MRDRFLDSAKGALIVLVVFGHFLEGWAPQGSFSTPPGWNQQPQMSLLILIYLFHMPLFIALAGMTARSRSAVNRAVQMLALYLPLQVLQIRLYGNGFNLESLLRPAYALWFLSALAIWLLLVPLIDRLPRVMMAGSVVLAVVAGLSGFDQSMYAHSRTVFYFPFFVAGHLYGKQLLDRARDVRLPGRLVAGLVAVGVTAAIVVVGVSARWITGTANLGSLDVDEMTMLGGRVATLGAMAVTSVAVLMVLPRSGSVLEALGRRSLAIYVLHQFIVREVRGDVPDWGAWELLAVSVVLTAVTVAVTQLPLFDQLLRDWAKGVGDAVTGPFTRRREGSGAAGASGAGAGEAEKTSTPADART